MSIDKPRYRVQFIPLTKYYQLRQEYYQRCDEDQFSFHRKHLFNEIHGVKIIPNNKFQFITKIS